MRRSSLATMPVLVTVPLSDCDSIVNNENENAGELSEPKENGTSDAVSVVTANVDIEAVNIDTINTLSIDMSGVAMQTNTRKVSSATSNEIDTVLLANAVAGSPSLKDAGHREVSLEVIYNEVLSLKSDNKHLIKLVSDLAVDKSKLQKKVDALESLIRSLNLNMSTNSTSLIKSNMNPIVNTTSWADVIASDHNSNNNSSTRANTSLLARSSTQLPKTILSTTNQANPLSASTAVNKNSLPIEPSSTALRYNQSLMTISPSTNQAKPLSAATVISANSSPRQIPETDQRVISVNDTHSNTTAPKLNSNNWTVINRKKRPKAVIGSCKSDELDVFAKLRWLHISSFKSSVSTDDIINYISKHTNLDNKNFACYKLVKKGVNVDELKFVNFKLGVPSNFYNLIFDSTLWPANIKIKPFDFLERPIKSTPEPNATLM